MQEEQLDPEFGNTVSATSSFNQDAVATDFVGVGDYTATPKQVNLPEIKDIEIKGMNPLDLSYTPKPIADGVGQNKNPYAKFEGRSYIGDELSKGYDFTAFDDVYVPYSDNSTFVSKVDAVYGGLDSHELEAQRMGAMSKVWRGLGVHFGTNTVLNFIGGTLGVVDGLNSTAKSLDNGEDLGVAVNDGFDTGTATWAKDMQTYLDSQYGVKTTKEYNEKEFWGKFATVNFWAKDVTDGAAFVAGAIASEAAWAFATGGASLALSIPKWGVRGAARLGLAGLSKAGAKQTSKKIGKALYWGTRSAETARNTLKVTRAMAKVKSGAHHASRASRLAEGAITTAKTVRGLATSTYFEASVESNAFLLEAQSKFEEDFLQTHGREATAAEYEIGMANITGAANSVFAANMVVVGLSNVFVWGKAMGLKKSGDEPVGGFFKRHVLGLKETAKTSTKKTAADIGKLQMAARSKFQKGLAHTTNVLKDPIAEGTQEVTQGFITSAATGFINGANRQEHIRAFKSEWQATAKTLSSKSSDEYLTEFMLGGILGAAGNIKTGFGLLQDSKDQKQLQDLVESNNARQERIYATGADSMFRASSETGEFMDLGVAATRNLEAMEASVEVKALEAKAEKAKAEGSFAEASFAHNRALSEKMHVDAMLGRSKQAMTDYMDMIDAMTKEELEEAFDIEVADAAQLAKVKDNMKSEYKATAKAFKATSEYASSVIQGNMDAMPEGVTQMQAQRAFTNAILAGRHAEEVAGEVSRALKRFLGPKSNAYDFLKMKQDEEASNLADSIMSIEDRLKENEAEAAKVTNEETSALASASENQHDAVAAEILEKQKKLKDERDALILDQNKFVDALKSLEAAKKMSEAQQAFNKAGIPLGYDYAEATSEEVKEQLKHLREAADQLEAMEKSPEHAEEVAFLLREMNLANGVRAQTAQMVQDMSHRDFKTSTMYSFLWKKNIKPTRRQIQREQVTTFIQNMLNAGADIDAAMGPNFQDTVLADKFRLPKTEEEEITERGLVAPEKGEPALSTTVVTEEEEEETKQLTYEGGSNSENTNPNQIPPKPRSEEISDEIAELEAELEATNKQIAEVEAEYEEIAGELDMAVVNAAKALLGNLTVADLTDGFLASMLQAAAGKLGFRMECSGGCVFIDNTTNESYEPLEFVQAYTDQLAYNEEFQRAVQDFFESMTVEELDRLNTLRDDIQAKLDALVEEEINAEESGKTEAQSEFEDTLNNSELEEEQGEPRSMDSLEDLRKESEYVQARITEYQERRAQVKNAEYILENSPPDSDGYLAAAKTLLVTIPEGSWNHEGMLRHKESDLIPTLELQRIAKNLGYSSDLARPASFSKAGFRYSTSEVIEQHADVVMADKDFTGSISSLLAAHLGNLNTRLESGEYRRTEELTQLKHAIEVKEANQATNRPQKPNSSGSSTATATSIPELLDNNPEFEAEVVESLNITTVNENGESC